jgi:hypothetical protein
MLFPFSFLQAQGPIYDVDAAAFFARVTAAGGSLTTTEKSATNQLVLDLKANSLWTPMKAIYPMVGASAEACKQNLKSSSFTGTFSSGWTFASTGVTPNGTSAYFNTNLNLLNDLSQDNSHFSVYLRTNITGVLCSGGAGNSNMNALQMFPAIGGQAYFNMFSSGGGNFVNSGINTLGLRLLNRIISTEINFFVNTTKYNKTLTSVAGANKNIYIGAHNGDAAPSSYDIRQNAFVSLGNGLTDTEEYNLYTAVQAFQTTLFRNV